MAYEVREGKVVEVEEKEVDVLAVKEMIVKYRDVAAYHTKLADDLEAKLAVPEVKAVVDAKMAEVELAKGDVAIEEVAVEAVK